MTVGTATKQLKHIRKGLLYIVRQWSKVRNAQVDTRPSSSIANFSFAKIKGLYARIQRCSAQFTFTPLQYFSLAHQYSCGDLSCSAVDDYGKHWWPMSQNGGHRVECEYVQVSISTIGREELTSNVISPHCALNCLGKWYTDQRHNFKHPWWQSSSRHGDPRVVLGYKQ